MDRLGLGFEALKKENPKLIYCAISGFGQDGPLRDLPAYDQIIQGMSGVMSITGAPENAPYRVGYPIADTIGGITAAFAVAAALADRDRTEGCFIDVSMLEATMATMGWAVSNYLIAGRTDAHGQRQRDGQPVGIVPHRRRAAQHRGQQAGAVRGRVPRHRPRRSGRRPALRRTPGAAAAPPRAEGDSGEALVTRPAREWWQLLNEAGVPAGPVYTVAQALAHPQIEGRGMVATFENAPGVGRDIRVVRTGCQARRRGAGGGHPPPALGSTPTRSSPNWVTTPRRSRRSSRSAV